MNKYASIDCTIRDWAFKHKLTLFTTCRDEEFRAINVVDKDGRIYGIGVYPPDSGNVTVSYHAWDFKKRHQTVTISINVLEATLDEALKIIHEWMAS